MHHILLITAGLTLSGVAHAACADSAIDSGETCDDGNSTSGDGCDSGCLLEPDYYCPTVGAACVSDGVFGTKALSPSPSYSSLWGMSQDGTSTQLVGYLTDSGANVGMLALAQDPDGVLFGFVYDSAGGGAALAEINPATAEVTTFGPTLDEYVSSAGFNGAGELWAISSDYFEDGSSHQLELVEVDPSTGDELSRIDLWEGSSAFTSSRGHINPFSFSACGDDTAVVILDGELGILKLSSGQVYLVGTVDDTCLAGLVTYADDVTGQVIDVCSTDTVWDFDLLTGGITSLWSDPDGSFNAGPADLARVPVWDDPDPDGDGICTLEEELIYGTDPNDDDSDSDGTLDGDEDEDGDGLSNATEAELGTDPFDTDTDDDGRTDDEEDADGDGLDNITEVDTYGSDPLDADTDDDGLIDSDETGDCDGVYNGGFELGDVSLSSGYTPWAGTPPLGYDEYTVTADATLIHSLFDGTANEGSYFAAFNGSDSDMFCFDRALSSGDDYTLEFDVDNLVIASSAGADPEVQAYADGVALSGCTPGTVGETDGWVGTSCTFTASATETVEICFALVSPAASGHDAGLDAVDFIREDCGDYVTDPADADTDDDGLDDGEEIDDHGTDPNDDDSDDDGLLDGEEIDTYSTDPLDDDSDDDGLLDGDEVNTHSTDPNDSDSDDDGCSDYDEVTGGSDPNVADADGDGVGDCDEIADGTDPEDDDSDDDGLTDFEEDALGTDPLDDDSDDDGLSDGDEVNTHSTDPLDTDSDDDGLTDGEEVNTTNTDPNDPDSDEDGLSDFDEVNTYGTEPNDEDSDDDGLTDGEEINDTSTDPNDQDSDDDLLSDGDEVNTHGTDPNDEDTDDGGIGDGQEVLTDGTDPLDETDDLSDRDGDGLSDWSEDNVYGTDPDNADTDGDGVNDGDEVSDGTDPLDADSDDDGLSDGEEQTLGTDPLDADSDDDGLSDGDEVNTHSTDPNDADSDADGLSDGDEVNTHSTDPNDADSDADGLSDGDEVNTHSTDPNDADSDGDGLSDGDEVNAHGTDPNDADSDDGGVDDGDELDNGTDPLDGSDDFPSEDTGSEITDPVGKYQGGGGCSQVPRTGAAWSLALFGLLLLRRRR